MTLKFCEKCKEYTLRDVCIKCNSKTVVRKPAKFSPDKNYAVQRLKTKRCL